MKKHKTKTNYKPISYKELSKAKNKQAVNKEAVTNPVAAPMVKPISKPNHKANTNQASKGCKLAYTGNDTLEVLKSNFIQAIDKYHTSNPVIATEFYLKSLTVQTQCSAFYYDQHADALKPDYPTPKEGEVGYFNLAVGYPKEISGGHWCYVLKDVGSKLFVIPMCSVKAATLNNATYNTSSLNTYVDFTINDDKSYKTIAKLSFSDARFVDKFRVDKRKATGKINMSHAEVSRKFHEIIGV